MAKLEGTRLGAYELEELVGGGGMAEVYLAKQKSAFDREVAIKVIRKGYAEDEDFRTRFLRAARGIWPPPAAPTRAGGGAPPNIRPQRGRAARPKTAAIQAPGGGGCLVFGAPPPAPRAPRLLGGLKGGHAPHPRR